MSDDPQEQPIRALHSVPPRSGLNAVEKFKLVLETLGVVALVFSALGLWLDFQSRHDDRINKAWGLVGTKVGLRTSLQYLNAENEDLAGLDLQAAQLPGIKLKGANLTGVNLTGANLEGADLSDVNFERAKLDGSDLTNAKLDRANLSNASFQKAFMEGATLIEANLLHTNFSDAHMLDVDLKGAKLFGANFTRVGYLSRAQILENSQLRWAKLPDGAIVQDEGKGNRGQTPVSRNARGK